MKHPLLPIALLFAIALAGHGCAINPVTGEQDVVLMSEAEEIALGRKNDAEVRKQYGVYDDARLQTYVGRVGQQLAAKSHRPHLKYHFTVLDSPEVNAFALPGGYIYITRGILAYLNSEAELAAVLGHEIGHVTARHSVRQYTTAVATGVGVSILSIVVPGFGNQAGQQLLDVLGKAIVSGYGRDHELESDRLGAEYLARTGYDPNAMLGVIGVLKNQEEFEKERAKAEGRQPRIYHGVFATHPSSDQRLQEVVGKARKFRAPDRTRIARDEYLDHLQGLTFGDSPREGVVRANRFLHRDLDLMIEFPAGWQLANSPKALTATSPARDATIQVLAEKRPAGDASPREYLRQRLKGVELTRDTALQALGGPAHGAVARLKTPYGARNTRVIALNYRQQSFLFFGVAKTDTDAAFGRIDEQVTAVVRGMRTLSPPERTLAQGLRLGLKPAPAGTTFAALAAKAPLNSHAELLLRLINDKFPSGEPVAGERIKLIE
jgi:predicted Zn-dependent protease